MTSKKGKKNEVLSREKKKEELVNYQEG